MTDPTMASPAVREGDLHLKVIADLRSMVMKGDLPAGQRIPEGTLCERFGISRTPLREALKVLAAEGFISLRPNRGAVVIPIDHKAVAELFEVKGAIERLIGLCLPERLDAVGLERIEALHLRLADAMETGDHETYTQLNHQFHGSLAAGTGNRELSQVYAGLQQKVMRARYAVNEAPDQVQRSMREHEVIMCMLRAGAARDLAHLLEDHNRRTGEAIAAQLRAECAAKSD